MQRAALYANPDPGPNPHHRQPRLRHRRSVDPPVEMQVQYNAGQRQGPLPMTLPDGGLHLPEDKFPSYLDFVWLLSRLLGSDSTSLGQPDNIQKTPGWSAFNALVQRDCEIRRSTVGYLPVIPTSPTQLSTVYVLLQRSIEVADQLDQNSVVIVLDQAIYCKAQEILWKNKEQFSRVVLRMGGFHIALTFLAVIGKRFGDAGLSDILVESGVVGSNAITGVVSGKHYNRAVRAHKIVVEALHRTLWKMFEESLEQHPGESNITNQLRSSLSDLRRSNFSPQARRGLRSLMEFRELFLSFRRYCANLTNPLAKFWLSYVHMVGLLLDFIRSSREADWTLHLQCIRKMLPWMFAYDRVNYSRYLTLYWCEMTALPETDRFLHDQFLSGEFCVQRSNSAFSQIPVDQTIEQTIKRDSKTKGGIIGFSRSPAAVQKWLINAHQRAEISRGCKDMAGLGENTTGKHKECSESRRKYGEASVQSVLSTMSTWPNPFSPLNPDAVLNISSGVIASNEVTSDLLQAHAIGDSQLLNFIEERLQSSSVSFYHPLHRNNLKTFTSLTKIKSVQVRGKEVIVRADRDLFGRMLVVAQTRALNLRDVLCYELGPVPWSISSVHGTLAKTAKCKLLEIIEKDVPPAERVPVDAAWMMDAMALLQSIASAPDKFCDLAEKVFHVSTAPFTSGTKRVDFVVDQYPDTSIKGEERKQRAKQGMLRVRISHRLQKCPTQWKKYLSVDENKVELAQFLAKEWSRPEYASRLQHRYFFVSHGTTCTRLTSMDGLTVTASDITSLECTHEEADTRLLLHAAHAGRSGYTTVVIKSPDTDPCLCVEP